MDVVVPFAAERPKTRLSAALSTAERRDFARVMLGDVLEALLAAGHEPTVLATAPLGEPVAADVVVDDRPLTDAVNARLAAAEGHLAVVMADLALLTTDAVDTLLAPDEAVVIAPGRGAGTNALVVREPAFRVDYHGTSYLDHRERAERCGASVGVVDSMRLATDIDEPADLVEVLVHGEGESPRWLRERGFELTTTGGRVAASRPERADGPGV